MLVIHTCFSQAEKTPLEVAPADNVIIIQALMGLAPSPASRRSAAHTPAAEVAAESTPTSHRSISSLQLPPQQLQASSSKLREASTPGKQAQAQDPGKQAQAQAVDPLDPQRVQAELKDVAAKLQQLQELSEQVDAVASRTGELAEQVQQAIALTQGHSR